MDSLVHPEFQSSYEDDEIVSYFNEDKVPKDHILQRLAETGDPRIQFIGGELAL